MPHQQDRVVRRRSRRPHAERHRPRHQEAQMRDARSQIRVGKRRHAAERSLRRAGVVFAVEAPLLRRRQWRRGAAWMNRVGPWASRSRISPTRTLSPAPLPGLADFRLKRFMGYVNWKRGRERLNDMALLAAPGRGPARPAPRPCGGDRRSRQHRHAGRIPPRRGLDGDARRSGATSVSCPAITTPMCARRCRC